MARIRAIKPEFWSSPNLPDDPWERLLYMALWNWADDKGVGTAGIRELLGFAFPNDEHITPGEFRRMLGGIHRAFDVKFYTVSGRPYYAIPNWEEHQKFDNRSKGKHPGPEFAETWLYQDFLEDPAGPAGIPPSTRRDPGAVTEEQGNRVTGEQRNRGTDTPAIPSLDIEPIFDDAYSHWPKKVERKQAFDRFVKLSKKRDPHELAADIIRFGDAYTAAGTEKQYVPGLGVWLNKERWTDELPVRHRDNSKPTKAEQAWNFVNGGGHGVQGGEAGVRGYLDQ